MHTLIGILSYVLIGVVVAPLLLVGLYALSSHFKLTIAERILDLVFRSLMIEIVIGGVVNIVGGLALSGLGVWATLNLTPLGYRLLLALLVPFGLWRTFIGGVFLHSAFSKTKDPIGTTTSGARGSRHR